MTTEQIQQADPAAVQRLITWLGGCQLCDGAGLVPCTCCECWGSMRRSRHARVQCDCLLLVPTCR